VRPPSALRRYTDNAGTWVLGLGFLSLGTDGLALMIGVKCQGAALVSIPFLLAWQAAVLFYFFRAVLPALGKLPAERSDLGALYARAILLATIAPALVAIAAWTVISALAQGNRYGREPATEVRDMMERTSPATNAPNGGSAGHMWPSAVGLVVVLAATSVFDCLVLLTRRAGLAAISLPVGAFLQAYFTWYYFAWFLPGRQMFAAQRREASRGYTGLFLAATFGTSLVALVASYAVHRLMRIRC
jgi:hypothetical protein